MLSLNDCSKAIAQALELLDEWVQKENVLMMPPSTYAHVDDARRILENALEKLTDKM